MTTVSSGITPVVSDGYIGLPITVDPNTLIQQTFAAIQTQIPGWVPREGQLDVAIIEEACAMFALCALMANQVPITIFEYYGSLVGILPNPGAFATAPVTFTMLNNAGYTIPAGTVVAYPQSGNQQVLFTLDLDIVIPSGSTTGTGTLTCETVGSFANNLAAATCNLVTTVAQVASVATTAASGGGVDPETATAYINRLSAELQLLTPRPITTSDFAAIATNVTGVYRALALDLLSPGRSVTDGVTTSASRIIGSATAHFTSNDVGRTVTDTAGNVPAGASISSVTSSTVAVLDASHPATGSGTGDHFTFGDLQNVERCVTVCGVQKDGSALTTDENTALLAYLEGLREVNFIVNTINPTYNEIDVTVTCYCQPGQTPSIVQGLIVSALGNYLTPTTWGGGVNTQIPVWEPDSNVVPFLEVANVVQQVAGVLYIPSGDLQIGLHGGSLGTSDITMNGEAPLPTAGTFTVTVTAAP